MEIVAVLLIGFIIYFVIENTVILRVRREKLSDGSVKIAHLSDLHKKTFGKNNSRLLKKTADENPDIIIFSGDIITRDCRDFTELSHFLMRLTKIAPVYFSYGNHELDLPEEYRKMLDDEMKKYGVHFAANDYEILEIKDRKFSITFAQLKRNIYKKNGSYRNLENYTYEDMINDVRKPETDCTSILIAHNPFFAETYEKWGADYTFSGHIHGGVIIIPFLKIGILSPERKFFPKYAKGVFEIGKMKLLISGGLGKLRLFNPPEIVVYSI
ncbi:MAG: metallophosphoesterase [Ruminococcus sp.]|nr:metallophosphoesterase [Ruminococcus sp.]